MSAFKPESNYQKHFIVRLVDRGVPELETLKVVDAFNDRCVIFLKDKRAVRDLIAQLILHMEDLEA